MVDPASEENRMRQPAAIFAHSTPGADETDWEALTDHLHEVAETAAGFASRTGLQAWAEAAGLLHDIGKVAPAYQAYIRGQGPSPDHSTAGAAEAVRRYGKTAGRLLAFVVAGHHAGLADGAVKDGPGRSLTDRLAATAGLPDYAGWENHAGGLPEMADLALPPSFRVDRRCKGFSTAFLTRMIFSCLVDADFLETERFYCRVKGHEIGRGGHRSLADLRDRLRNHMTNLNRAASQTPLNRLRADILDHAIGRAAQSPGLFTLTVPTGGGKTLASLSFALEHAVTHDLRRVIYVIPYTSIIEQTADVFRKALGTSEDILEHHGSFDRDRDGQPTDAEGRDGLEKLRRASENWDVPIVVTTAVQFFESLFAARTGRCRKLHNIANSVVILDEAQTVPLGVLRPCMAAIDELARNYRTSLVLCTATQPALRTIDKALPHAGGKGDDRQEGFAIGADRELAPDPEGLYRALKRVEISVRAEPATDAEIAARFAGQEQMLCIVNTRKHARDLFEAIRHLPGAAHLTTLMCPAHRRKALAGIRQRLRDRLPVRLVATSLIEAGVDVDFPEVWRAETGLDSIAQAAGRCNREGSLTMGRLIVFTAADHTLPRPFRAARDAARVPLGTEDPLGLDAVRAYFQALYFKCAHEALDTAEVGGLPGVLPALARSAPDLDFPFASIAAGFHLIEDTMRPVIVPYRYDGDRTVDRLLRDLEQVDRPGGIARRLQQYSVPVPARIRAGLISSGAASCVNPAKFDMDFVRIDNESLYDLESGLKFDDPHFRNNEDNVI